jgi:hypothetical protein
MRRSAWVHNPVGTRAGTVPAVFAPHQPGRTTEARQTDQLDRRPVLHQRLTPTPWEPHHLEPRLDHYPHRRLGFVIEREDRMSRRPTIGSLMRVGSDSTVAPRRSAGVRPPIPRAPVPRPVDPPTSSHRYSDPERIWRARSASPRLGVAGGEPPDESLAAVVGGAARRRSSEGRGRTGRGCGRDVRASHCAPGAGTHRAPSWLTPTTWNGSGTWVPA